MNILNLCDDILETIEDNVSLIRHKKKYQEGIRDEIQYFKNLGYFGRHYKQPVEDNFMEVFWTNFKMEVYPVNFGVDSGGTEYLLKYNGNISKNAQLQDTEYDNTHQLVMYSHGNTDYIAIKDKDYELGREETNLFDLTEEMGFRDTYTWFAVYEEGHPLPEDDIQTVFELPAAWDEDVVGDYITDETSWCVNYVERID